MHSTTHITIELTYYMYITLIHLDLGKCCFKNPKTIQLILNNGLILKDEILLSKVVHP